MANHELDPQRRKQARYERKVRRQRQRRRVALAAAAAVLAVLVITLLLTMRERGVRDEEKAA